LLLTPHIITPTTQTNTTVQQTQAQDNKVESLQGKQQASLKHSEEATIENNPQTNTRDKDNAAKPPRQETSIDLNTDQKEMKPNKRTRAETPI